jgi:hypothetical protein
MQDDFGNFVNEMQTPPFRKNAQGQWDFHTKEGRDPFYNSGYNNPLGPGATYSLNPDGTVGVAEHARPGIPGAGQPNMIRGMASNMLDASGGWPGEWQRGGFSAGGPGGMGGGPGGGMLMKALQHDMMSQQYADQQRADNLQQGQIMQNAAFGAAGRVGGGLAASAADLRARANQMDAVDQMFAQNMQQRAGRPLDANAIYARGLGDINKATAEGDRAMAGLTQARKNVGDMAEEDASSAAYAIKRNTESQKTAAMGQGGNTMSKDQLMEMSRAMDMDGAAQRQQTVTQIHSDYRRRATEMDGMIAQMQQANANLKMQGAQMGQQAALTAHGMQQDDMKTRMAWEQVLQQGREMALKYREMASNIYNTGLLQSAELELQGRTALANAIRENPRSMTSWLQGLLAIQGAQAASRMA